MVRDRRSTDNRIMGIAGGCRGSAKSSRRSVRNPMALYSITQVTEFVDRHLLKHARWLLILTILIFPIFAHGCHRDDVDNEPGVVPPVNRIEPESPP
jgi:hypothetical protein